MKRITTTLVLLFALFAAHSALAQQELEDFENNMMLECEAKFQSQQLNVARNNPENPPTVRFVLSQLFKEAVPYDKMYVIRGSVSDESTVITITGQDNVLDYNIQPSTDALEPYTVFTLCDSKSEIKPLALFVQCTFGMRDRYYYYRVSFMQPTVTPADDLSGFKSNASTATASFILAYDREDPAPRLELLKTTYESMKTHIEADAELTKQERCLRTGLFDYEGTFYYYGYGDWLYEQHRVYDAYMSYIRVYNDLNRNYHKLEAEVRDMYYDVCNKTAKCLMDLNDYENALYYITLAKKGGKASTVEVTACKKKLQAQIIERGSKTTSSNVTLGYVLGRLYAINAENVENMAIVKADGRTVIKEKGTDIMATNLDDLCGEETAVAMRYTRAGYKTESKTDLSSTSALGSVVIYVHKVPRNDSTFYRFSIMVPNFKFNDDKMAMDEDNMPLCKSFIYYPIKNVNPSKLKLKKLLELSLVTDVTMHNPFPYLMLLDATYAKVYGSKSGMAQDKISVNSSIGRLLLELNKPEAAFDFWANSRPFTNSFVVTEYINSLRNSNDIRVMEEVLDIEQNAKFHGDDAKKMRLFFKRSKAFALIDMGELDKAEALLNELLQDGDEYSKTFAEHELMYIKQLRQQE